MAVTQKSCLVVSGTESSILPSPLKLMHTQGFTQLRYFLAEGNVRAHHPHFTHEAAEAPRGAVTS